MNKKRNLLKIIGKEKILKLDNKYCQPKVEIMPQNITDIFGNCGRDTDGCKAKNKEF